MSVCWACMIFGAIWICLQIASTLGACPQGYYGLGCHYTCHCPPANCDTITGCSGNCKRGWSGPICTQENIALGKATFQSSYYSTHWVNSSLAVDGDLTQGLYASNCILTATTEPFTWWTVDLGRDYYIHELVIHFRKTYTVRRNGVEVYASRQNNSLNTGHLCGTANSNSPDNTLMTCDHVVRYITLYQATYNDGDTAMNFCEVEVYVCQGTYGQDCSLRCSDRNCKDGNAACDHVTGSCGGRCQAGWHGDTCTNVCQGTYGQDCSLRCSDRHCKDGNAACDHVTGSCGGRCQAGWHGDTCTNVCQGTYGQDCSLRCSDRNCKDGNAACDHVTGSCGGRCQAGWHGDTCTNMCQGTYGQDCSLRCSDRNCKDGNAACDHVTGSCGGRCQAGWQGDTCSNACQRTYGQDCSLRCSVRHCKYNALCDHVTGSCGGQCQAGWLGDRCTNKCSQSTYGKNCTNLCSLRHCHGYSSCNHVTGGCNHGCDPGYQSVDCTKPCVEGRYGYNCNMSCDARNCAVTSLCDTRHGTCISCLNGWQLPDCTTECRDRTFGPSCKFSCNERHCKGNRAECDVQNGVCSHGCQPGWKNSNCTEQSTTSVVTETKLSTTRSMRVTARTTDSEKYHTEHVALISVGILSVLLTVALVISIVILTKRQRCVKCWLEDSYAHSKPEHTDMDLHHYDSIGVPEAGPSYENTTAAKRN